MSAEEMQSGLYFLINIIALWCIVVFGWRSYRADAFKQDLAELKDELFDLASSGKIDFSHPSYRLLQSRIDALIKWAPRLTATHFLIAFLFRRSYAPLLKNRWDQPESAHPLREQILAIHQWLLVRAFFQALSIPAFVLPATRIVWGLAQPASKSIGQIARAANILDRFKLTDPVKLLVQEAVEFKKVEDAKKGARSASGGHT